MFMYGSVALPGGCSRDVSEHGSIRGFVGCVIETMGKTFEVGD